MNYKLINKNKKRKVDFAKAKIGIYIFIIIDILVIFINSILLVSQTIELLSALVCRTIELKIS
jgi:hypothetical protein